MSFEEKRFLPDGREIIKIGNFWNDNDLPKELDAYYVQTKLEDENPTYESLSPNIFKFKGIGFKIDNQKLDSVNFAPGDSIEICRLLDYSNYCGDGIVKIENKTKNIEKNVSDWLKIKSKAA